MVGNCQAEVATPFTATSHIEVLEDEETQRPVLSGERDGEAVSVCDNSEVSEMVRPSLADRRRRVTSGQQHTHQTHSTQKRTHTHAMVHIEGYVYGDVTLDPFPYPPLPPTLVVLGLTLAVSAR